MKNFFKRKIDWIFFNQKRIENAVQIARVDNPRDVPVIGDKNKISDPTAQTALYNLTPLSFVVIGGDILKYPERWLTVIDKTYNWCKKQSDTHEQAVKRKYLGEHYLRICRELSISPTNLYSMIDTARMYATLQAAQLNLVHID